MPTFIQGGWTLLIAASIHRYTEIVEYLLSVGANPNIDDYVSAIIGIFCMMYNNGYYEYFTSSIIPCEAFIKVILLKLVP